MKPCTEFDNQYLNIIEECYSHRIKKSIKTGEKYQSTGPVSLLIKGLPILTLQDVNIRYLINDLINLVGCFKDGLMTIMHSLLCDPTLKNCLLSIGHIGVGSPSPYIAGIHFSIIENKFCMSVLQTSSNILKELPYTVTKFCLIWHMLSIRLNFEVGTCVWTVGNVYIPHSQKRICICLLKEFSKRIGEVPNFNFKPGINDLGFAMQGKKSLVHDIYHQLQPAYDRLKGPKL